MSDVADGPTPGSRLAGIDGLHLHIETDRAPTHTLKVFIVEAIAGKGKLEADDVVAVFHEMVQAFPFFRLVPVSAPAGIDQPRWIPASKVDLDYHVRTRSLPTPGGPTEFDAAVAALTESRLASDRPMWQAWVFDGLAEGRIGIVLKLHHSLADGVAAANLLELLTGADYWPAATAGPVPPPRRPTVARAARSRAHCLRELPLLVRDTRRAVRAVRQLELADLGTPGPHNPLRGAVSASRSFATASLPLEEIRSARAAAPGATVNDVMLSLVGGALRKILGARGELPTRTMLAVVPVSTDPLDGAKRLWGNGFSQLFTTLSTDTDDPIERLATIHQTTLGRKQAQQCVGNLAARWWDQIPPALLRGSVATASRLGLIGRVPLPGVSISNVRGPSDPIRLPRWGFEIVELYSVGPVLNGTGLNVTAWSYQGRMQVVALSDSAMITDAHDVTEAMAIELDRILEAIE